MNTYSNPYHYRETIFYIQSTSNRYWVRISYQPKTINQTALLSSQEYETPHYSLLSQAISHAKGWVNRMLDHYIINQIPNNNRDFCENRDRALLDQLEDSVSSGISKDKLDLAYWEGWKSKDDELNNI